jgi:plastocyanin
MNKKIAIIPIVIIIAIIGAVSQMNIEETSETETVEIETVEEVEAMITIPVKAARPACGPHPECYIPSYYVTKLSEPVTWKNEDSAFHSVTSGSYGEPDELFDSGHLDPYEIFSYKFEEPGMYPYYCTLHPWMAGNIKVER